jgi:hypothetical protein
MSKKSKEREKEEEKDLEDEDEEGSEGEDEEEESHASSKPARARARAVARHDDEADDHGHGHDDDEDEDDDGVDPDDPTWWAPHAVLAVLVLTGVLGFFGAFNRFLGGKHAAAGAEAKPATTQAAATGAGHGATPPPRPGATAQAGETYGAKHLLVMYKGSMRAPASITRTEDEAKTRAGDALKKAKSGTKFEDVVKEYSDEPGAAQRGGDLGSFRKGQMVPEFQNAVEKMKVGEISDLVKTPFGYHVILRTK